LHPVVAVAVVVVVAVVVLCLEQNNLKPMDIISTLKPKYQAVMRIVFGTAREEVASVADALARGEGAATGLGPAGGPPRATDASGGHGAGAGAPGAGGAGGDVGSALRLGGPGGGPRLDTGGRGLATLESTGRTTKTFSPKKRK
jgi:hypothetical protein